MRGPVVELAHEAWGAGPTLVFLHAFPLGRRMWLGELEAFSPSCHSVAIDLRGFGESPLGPGSYGMDDLASDVVALLDRLAVESAVVVGLSMGGYVALALAEHHAERLAGLVLADTRAGPDSEDGRRVRDQAIQQLREEGPQGYLEATARKLLRPGAGEGLVARVLALCERRVESLTSALAALRDRPDRRAVLPRIHCPTLVVVGAQDTVTPPSESQAMAAAIPGARLVELPQAGHLSNLESDAGFDRAVAGFLDLL